MSLLNIIKRGAAVDIVTDGAVIDDNGFVAAFAPKVILAPHLCAAIAFRGELLVSQHIGNMLLLGSHKYRTFDGLRAKIVQDTRELLAALVKGGFLLKSDDSLGMEVAVGGWSESAGSAAYYFHTSKKSPLGAWRMQDQDIVRCSPTNEKNGQDCLDLLSADEPLFEQRVIDAANLQRGCMERVGSRMVLSPLVGGFLQLTTITQSDLRTRIIHRWADKIGEPLGREL